MPGQIEVRVHVPDNLGLTEQQLADLKQKVRVEIVASITAKTEQQIVIEVVDHHA
jgi:hypothetical protein